MTKLKFKSDIFFKVFIIFLYFFFFHIYIKVSKNLSAKYYQENTERLQKKQTHERYQNLSKEEKERKATIWL